ncbi:MAG: DUF302 domain-containing protein [Betaproteobacteria bacterium]|nr:DUF302 domain-containing protein [Betaproteobacteria bacterium]
MKRIVAVSIFCAIANGANAADGLIELKSAHSATETGTRLAAAIEARKLTLFARIDHAAGAKKIDKTLRPTEVFIFGNPNGGTPLMECAQSMGIDLPLKMLVWQAADGSVMLGYNDPAWLAKRHGTACEQPVGNISKALDGIAKSVVAP